MVFLSDQASFFFRQLTVWAVTQTATTVDESEQVFLLSLRGCRFVAEIYRFIYGVVTLLGHTAGPWRLCWLPLELNSEKYTCISKSSYPYIRFQVFQTGSETNSNYSLQYWVWPNILLCLRRSSVTIIAERMAFGVVTLQKHTAGPWRLCFSVLLFLHLNTHPLTWRENRKSNGALSTIWVPL